MLPRKIEGYVSKLFTLTVNDEITWTESHEYGGCLETTIKDHVFQIYCRNGIGIVVILAPRKFKCELEKRYSQYDKKCYRFTTGERDTYYDMTERIIDYVLAGELDLDSLLEDFNVE